METAKPPFSITGIDHILLHVNGMSEALAFYENVLGCTVEQSLPKFGMAELRAGGSHIDLVDVTSPGGAWAKSGVEGGRNLDHFALTIRPRDVQSLRKHLATRDVAITEEREEEGPQGKSLSLYVRDPSGNTIELISAVAS
ncbi:MAG TPA: VOC family protein [Candidatus Eremiobacteraceae bacterium]|nr:VOC family protein [Candidatus Eremiobacteraceae bacterium]